MLNHANPITCEEFQRHLAELIDSGADTEEAASQPHAISCAQCGQLVEELKTIAAAARSLYAPNEMQ